MVELGAICFKKCFADMGPEQKMAELESSKQKRTIGRYSDL